MALQGMCYYLRMFEVSSLVTTKTLLAFKNLSVYTFLLVVTQCGSEHWVTYLAVQLRAVLSFSWQQSYDTNTDLASARSVKPL